MEIVRYEEIEIKKNFCFHKVRKNRYNKDLTKF